MRANSASGNSSCGLERGVDTLGSQTTLRMEEGNGRSKQLRLERKNRSQILTVFVNHVHFLPCCSVCVVKLQTLNLLSSPLLKGDMKSVVLQREAVSLGKKMVSCCLWPWVFFSSVFFYVSGCVMIVGKLQCDLNIGHLPE